MPKFTVELTKQEVVQAISEWAEKHHGMKVAADDVTYSARTEIVGNGVNEMETSVPFIKFTTS